MSNSTLLVCQSCRLSDQDDENSLADGALLLNQLLTLHQQSSRQAELEIQPVSCLLTCRQPCAVALQSANKCTYLFTHLPLLESAEALIQFSELYLDSQDGNVPWKKIPEILKTNTIARIPFIGQVIEDED
jgi:predicted metal-binding protein